MRLPMFGLAAGFIVTAAIMIAIRLDGGGLSTVPATELRFEPRASVVEAAPGEIVIIASREYHRGSGLVWNATSGERVPVPNDTITTTWLLIGDEPGTISKKHSVQRDLAGNVVQEELYERAVEYVYFAPGGKMRVWPQNNTWTFSLSEDINTILENLGDEAVYRGETRINNRDVHLIERRWSATQSQQPLSEGGYRGIDTSDLDVREFVSRFAYDVDDHSFVQREMVAVDASGVETLLSSRTIDDVSISAVAALPEDTFSLQFVPQGILERDG